MANVSTLRPHNGHCISSPAEGARPSRSLASILFSHELSEQLLDVRLDRVNGDLVHRVAQALGDEFQLQVQGLIEPQRVADLDARVGADPRQRALVLLRLGGGRLILIIP